MKRLMPSITLWAILGITSMSFAQSTITLNSTSGVDGIVTSGGSVMTIAEIFAGDTYVNTGVRGFVSFDIASIPPGATIISATLKMYQEAVNGTPYADLGNIMVDHIDYGPTLDSDDYSLLALEDDIGTISNNGAFEFKTLDVTESLQDDMDHGRTRSQYRLRFPTQTDNDSIEDAAFFVQANYGDNSPKLVVIYEGSPVSPESGTIGTQITILGTGFGAKKGKVYLGAVALKVLVWNDELIQCVINKRLDSSTYDITIQPKEPKGAPEIVFENAFSVEAPWIESVNPTEGGQGAEVTIVGDFFGIKKGKVTLGGVNCRVLSWTMDPSTGESQVHIEVPKRLSSGTYDLTVSNQVGSDTMEGAFTIP